jgi:hypothetical protein
LTFSLSRDRPERYGDPLRHNPLAAQLAGVHEYDLAVAEKCLFKAMPWDGLGAASGRAQWIIYTTPTLLMLTVLGGCAMRVLSDAAAYAQHQPDEGTKP